MLKKAFVAMIVAALVYSAFVIHFMYCKIAIMTRCRNAGDFIMTTPSVSGFVHRAAPDIMVSEDVQRYLEYLEPICQVDSVRPDFGDEEMQLLSRSSSSFQGISIEGTGVTDIGISHLTKCPELEWLLLGGTKITDTGVFHMGPFPQLIHLSLSNTAITDRALQRLQCFRKVYILDLSYTNISDAGMPDLSRLTELTMLNLVGTQITDAGLSKLAPLRNLVILDMAFCPLTLESLDLVRQFPQISECYVGQGENVVPYTDTAHAVGVEGKSAKSLTPEVRRSLENDLELVRRHWNGERNEISNIIDEELSNLND